MKSLSNLPKVIQKSSLLKQESAYSDNDNNRYNNDYNN